MTKIGCAEDSKLFSPLFCRDCGSGKVQAGQAAQILRHTFGSGARFREHRTKPNSHLTYLARLNFSGFCAGGFGEKRISWPRGIGAGHRFARLYEDFAIASLGYFVVLDLDWKKLCYLNR